MCGHLKALSALPLPRAAYGLIAVVVSVVAPAAGCRLGGQEKSSARPGEAAGALPSTTNFSPDPSGLAGAAAPRSSEPPSNAGDCESASVAGSAASVFSFEGGLRYWPSTGKASKELYNHKGTSLVSRLTYDDLDAHSSEVFFNAIHNPTGIFVKASSVRAASGRVFS